jgi:hypothetical protein
MSAPIIIGGCDGRKLNRYDMARCNQPIGVVGVLGATGFQRLQFTLQAWIELRASMTAKALPSSGVFVSSVLFGTSGFCGTCVIDGILVVMRASPAFVL